MSSALPCPEPAPTGQIVRSFDGTEIHYDLYDAPSRAAVLVVPGFWRDRRHPSMVQLANSLNELGYLVAILDLRGHGDSGGTYGFNYNEHYDVAAVADDLLRHSRSVASITLVGLSYGGAIAISTAARHELPIASLLLISPVADRAMVTPRLNPFTMHRHIAFSQALKRPRFEWRVRRSPSFRALDDITSVSSPVCLIHVKNDWLVDHRHSIALYENHADRIFRVASAQVDPIVREFLERYTPR